MLPDTITIPKFPQRGAEFTDEHYSYKDGYVVYDLIFYLAFQLRR